MTPANDNTKPITATYLDCSTTHPAKLVPHKTRRGLTYRWEDDRGFTCDGLRQGVYSIAYQLRHARSHARFTDVQGG